MSTQNPDRMEAVSSANIIKLVRESGATSSRLDHMEKAVTKMCASIDKVAETQTELSNIMIKHDLESQGLARAYVKIEKLEEEAPMNRLVKRLVFGLVGTILTVVAIAVISMVLVN